MRKHSLIRYTLLSLLPLVTTACGSLPLSSSSPDRASLDAPPSVSSSGQARGPAVLSRSDSYKGNGAIVVDMSPAAARQKVAAFWRRMGIPLARTGPNSQRVETQWAYNYGKQLKKEDDSGSLLPNLSDDDLLDRFIVRIDTDRASGNARLSLSHEARTTGVDEADPLMPKPIWVDTAADEELTRYMQQQLRRYLGLSA